ncbi:MAG: hypothetical protein U9N10_07115 [Bacillota bacterium]|nr:hypothetical protein [Bacillota bacterium]
MKKAVVIPTYWGELNGEEEIIFDHPTPLYTKGCLGRLLDNLLTFDDMKDIEVYVIGVSNKNSLNEEVELYLREYIKPYKKKLNIKLFSYDYFLKLTAKLSDRKNLNYLFNCKGYSQVRNFSLLPVIMNDVDKAIFLDDDEIIEELDFFKKAFDKVNEDSEHGKIYGKAGYYLNNGSYRLPIEKVPYWCLGGWNKVKYMNETFDKLIKSEKRYSLTSIALGGNMILNKEIIKNICYDIYVDRGEDMDYLFNSKVYNYNILFDNKLKITHLPPKHSSLEWKRAKSDFYRFKYARRKLECLNNHKELNQITINDMGLYPGTFIRKDLEVRAKEYMQMLGMHYLSIGEIENYNGTMENLKVIFDNSNDEIDLIEQYKKQ